MHKNEKSELIFTETVRKMYKSLTLTRQFVLWPKLNRLRLE